MTFSLSLYQARILIADDHELVRRGLISILSRNHTDWQVVADVSTGTAAIELGTALRPDVVILDLSMPDIDGLQVAEQLLELVPGIRIVVLSVYAAAPILRRLRKAGVSAYLAKNEAPKMLVYAVERVLAGDPFFASTSATRPTVEAPEYIPVQFLLTPRELDVLHLLARGKSNKEIGANLYISETTVKGHLRNIFVKLKVLSRTEAVTVASRRGLVQL